MSLFSRSTWCLCKANYFSFNAKHLYERAAMIMGNTYTNKLVTSTWDYFYDPWFCRKCRRVNRRRRECLRRASRTKTRRLTTSRTPSRTRRHCLDRDPDSVGKRNETVRNWHEESSVTQSLASHAFVLSPFAHSGRRRGAHVQTNSMRQFQSF